MGVFDFFDIDLQNYNAIARFVNNGKKSDSPTFLLNKRGAAIEIAIPRVLGASLVSLCTYDEYAARLICITNGEWKSTKNNCDVYAFNLDVGNLGRGIFFYKFSIDSAYGRLYCGKRDGKFAFSQSEFDVDFAQFTVYSNCYKSRSKFSGGTIYHVFVDRFNRSSRPQALVEGVIIDDFKDGITEYPQYPGAPLKNNRFYGGNLRGIINKLDYIKSFGTTLIYLSPIFEAESNHKYDTANYMKIDAMFGDESDFCELVRKAGEKGMGILLDGVFNHTGSNSIYFNKKGKYDTSGAYQSKDSEFYPWYEFQEFPDKYTCWWGIDILPRINTAIPECRDYFVGDGGVIDKYARLGIAGFRLDVADELSDAFIADVKRVLAKNSPDTLLYGEVWEDASNKVAYGVRKHYYLGNELDGVMNYPIRTGIIDFIKDKRCEALRYALTDIINNAPEKIRNSQMNLLGTHDTDRIITVLGGDSKIGLSNADLVNKRMTKAQRRDAVRKVMTAYTILATVPGVPAIFYGDEAGLEGYGDPFNRMPYPWGKENKSLISHYRKIAQIRDKSQYAFKHGKFKLIELNENCLIFARYARKYAYLTVVNNSDKKMYLELDKKAIALISGSVGTVHTLTPNMAEILKIQSDSNIIKCEFDI